MDAPLKSATTNGTPMNIESTVRTVATAVLGPHPRPCRRRPAGRRRWRRSESPVQAAQPPNVGGSGFVEGPLPMSLREPTCIQKVQLSESVSTLCDHLPWQCGVESGHKPAQNVPLFRQQRTIQQSNDLNARPDTMSKALTCH